MKGPYWNPNAMEIVVVLEGQGMVRVVCPSNERDCKNTSFEVEEGDVFAVPRFHTVVEMSFNNDTFVFIGFSISTTEENYQQFLAGKRSVLLTLDREVLALSLNVSMTTISELLPSQKEEEAILDCTSCAEEEIAREREEEESKETEPHGGGGEEEEEEGHEGGGGEREEEGSEETEPHGGGEGEEQEEEEGSEETERHGGGEGEEKEEEEGHEGGGGEARRVVRKVWKA